MKIAIASDMHLEHGGWDFDFPEADVLVLAGDILVIDDLRKSFELTNHGIIARNFLIEAAALYKHIIYIPGNHEFYGGYIDNSSDLVFKFFDELGIKNISFGSKGTVTVDDVTFIFATLWTDLKKSNPIVVASANMADYDHIMILDSHTQSGSRHLNPLDTVHIHDEHKKFISDMWHDQAKKVVVVTHHAPNLMSRERDVLSVSDYYYCCTDLDDFILDRSNIKYWIHGHLHTRKEYTIGNTRVISNCRGYFIHESEKVKSFKVKVIDV